MGDGDLDALKYKFKAMKPVTFSIRHAPRPAVVSLLAEYTTTSETCVVYSKWPECTEFIVVGYVIHVRRNPNMNPVYYISDGSRRISVTHARVRVAMEDPFPIEPVRLVRAHIQTKPSDHKFELVSITCLNTYVEFITGQIHALHTYLLDLCCPRHWVAASLIQEGDPVIARVNAITDSWAGTPIETDKKPMELLCERAVQSHAARAWLSSLWLKPEHTERYAATKAPPVPARSVCVTAVADILKSRYDVAWEIIMYLMSRGILVTSSTSQEQMAVTLTTENVT